MDLSLVAAQLVGPVGELAGDAVRPIDLDGDGRDELMVGSPLASLHEGAARASAGVLQLLWVDGGLPEVLELDALPADLQRIAILGAGPGDVTAYSITSGDVDGDGVPDIITNAMNDDGPADTWEDAGGVYVVSGRALRDWLATPATL